MRHLVAAAFAVALGFARSAHAQDEVAGRQVNVIVPFTAGGTTDMFARILAQHMQAKFGPPFIVENRAGAAGNVGTTAVARAPKDGYTILVGTVSTHAINPFLYKNLPHDTEKDFQPVSLIARLPSPRRASAHSGEERRGADRASEGQSRQAQLRLLRGRHLDILAELFQMTTGTKMTRTVPQLGRRDERIQRRPYRPHLRQHDARLAAGAGRHGARARGVEPRAPARRRPTCRRSRRRFRASRRPPWHGVFVPAGTPRPVVEKINAEVRRIVELPEVVELTEIGAVPSPMTPEEFTAFIKAERTKWDGVVKAARLVEELNSQY